MNGKPEYDVSSLWLPAEEVIQRVGIERTMAELEQATKELGELYRKVYTPVAPRHGTEAEMKARAEYDRVVLEASLKAPQDGKNAEIRKRQLDDYLLHDPAVQQSKALLEACEKQGRAIANEVERTRGEFEAARARWMALLATLDAQREMLALLGGALRQRRSTDER